MPVDNHVRNLQYKIVFRIIATNKFLYQIKIKSTPFCPICLLSVHTLEHLFYECLVVKNFWVTLSDMCKYHNNNLNVSLSDIIFGYKPRKFTRKQIINKSNFTSKAFYLEVLFK